MEIEEEAAPIFTLAGQITHFANSLQNTKHNFLLHSHNFLLQQREYKSFWFMKKVWITFKFHNPQIIVENQKNLHQNAQYVNFF